MVTDAERTSLPLLGALATAAGASWTLAKVRAGRELAAFVQAGGTLPGGPDAA